MKETKIRWTLGVALCSLFLLMASTTASAQELPARAKKVQASPSAGVTQDIGAETVTITYGRTGVKGREVFGSLVPYGRTWRTGANEATVFATTADVTINGESLPAGVYAFFAIPGESEWTLIFNSEAAQWGAFNHDADKDVLRVTATPEHGPNQEWLSYSFGELSNTSATAYLSWAEVVVPFTVALAN